MHVKSEIKEALPPLNYDSHIIYVFVIGIYVLSHSCTVIG